MSKFEVTVYDTCSNSWKKVEVSKEVYLEYNRGSWNISKQDQSFYEHQIQFSGLIGGAENAFENFEEFKVKTTLEEDVDEILFKETVRKIILSLNPEEQNLYFALYEEEKTIREIANDLNLSNTAIVKRKKKLCKKMLKIMQTNGEFINFDINMGKK